MKNGPETKSPTSPASTLQDPIRAKTELADIVISINGRDAGKRFIVIETDAEYSLIADGKSRKYEKPKRKKNKHLKFEDKADSIIADKLLTGGKITNNEIRRFLASYESENQDSTLQKATTDTEKDRDKKEGCNNAKRRHD